MIRIAAGQTWFVVLPKEIVVTCVSIDEVTKKTVAVRPEPDLGRITPAKRYVRDEVRFVERIP